MNFSRKKSAMAAVLCASMLIFVVSAGAQTTGYITVKGSVLNETGALQPGVRVIFSSNADPRKLVQYDVAASGTFFVYLLPIINYNLRIMADAYPLQYYDPAMPSINAAGPPVSQLTFHGDDSVIVHLTQAPRPLTSIYGFIRGMVTDSAKRPLRNAEVMVLMPGKDVVADVYTDSTGNFLCKVPAQPQLISAVCAPYPLQFWSVNGTAANPTTQSIVVVPPNGTIPINITLRMNQQDTTPTVPVTRNGNVSGNVSDQVASRPLGGVTIYAISQDSITTIGSFDPQTAVSPFSALTSPAGAYTIMNIPQGRYFMLARAPGFVSQVFQYVDMPQKATPVVVDTGMVTMINFTLRASTPVYGVTHYGSISGVATAQLNNQPVAGAIVNALQMDSAAAHANLAGNTYQYMYSPYSDTTGSDGSYSIKNIPAGRYMVFAKGQNYIAQFYANADSAAKAKTLSIDSNGLTGIDFLLRTGGAISGSVVTKQGKPLGGININLTANGGNYSLNTMTDSTGKFLFSGLSAGKYCLNANSSMFLTSQDTNLCNYTVTEGAALAGIVVRVDQGGVITGSFSAQSSRDTVSANGFEIALFPDSLIANNAVLFESRTALANVNYPAAGTFVSTAVPVGKWRLVFRPQSPYPQQTSAAQPFVQSWSYSFGTAGAGFFNSAAITIKGGDTVRGIAVNFDKGYAVTGHMTFETGLQNTWSNVSACIKEGNYFIPVAHCYGVTNGVFTLPGLKDNQDYYIRMEASKYPMQYWSSAGPTAQPSVAYRFSTTSFVPLNIGMVMKPSGYSGNYANLTANAFVNDSNQLWVTCNAPQGLTLDTIVLFSKDPFGDLVKVNTFSNTVRQTTLSWKETRPWSSSFFSYVFIGTGIRDSVRSNVTGYDPFGKRKISPDSLLINVYPGRWGVRVDWRADTAAPVTERDTTILYRKSDAEAWKPMSTVWGMNMGLWDNSWDKTKDTGKTVSYKVEMSRGGTVARRSQIVQFTATREFFSRFGNNLAVGQYQTYKTIQQAVDAAKNFDNINVDAGTYAENIDCKGKILSIRGNWNSGVPPVIDGMGGVAISVPYPSISQGIDNVSIGGFKIRNSQVGVKSSANININQCLFVNIVQKAFSGVADSAAMAKAAGSDPFVDYRVNQNIWQCTFIGQNLSGLALEAVSRNNIDTAGQAMGRRILPAISIYVNNSLFAYYSMTVFPASVQGAQSTMNIANCDCWQTSRMFGSSQITSNGSMFTADPQFADTINYFLPDNSQLRTIAANRTTIGYDQQRFWSSGQVQLPPLAAVTGVKTAITGPHTITVTWNKLPVSENVDAYIVFRVLGYDSLFFVNSSSYWEPKKSSDSMYTIVDSFATKDSVFIDSSVAVGVPYLYAVIGTKADGSRSNVKLAYPPALSAYTIKIDAPSASGIRNLSHREAGFTMITLQWNRPLVVKADRPVYSVCRIHGGSALSAAGNDSASVRRILQSLKSSGLSVDTFATADTVFVDATARMDTAYVYVITVADSALPVAQRPLAWTAAKIDKTVFKAMQPFHAKADRWNMVGPWARGSITFSAPSSAVMYQWDDMKEEDKLMSSYVAAGEMKSGAGYWFKSGVDTVINVTDLMFGQLITDHDSMAISLVKGRSGWNQIASAFPFSVRPTWLGNGRFTAYEWVADSMRYQEAATLKPWKGYWLNCDKDTQLVIKASDVAVIPNGNILAKRMQQAAWELKVSYSGNGGDPDNFIGVVPAASSKPLRLEGPKPPQAFDFTQVYFLQANGVEPAPVAAMKKLAKLYKSSSAAPARKLEWMVGISSSAKDGTIRVSGCEAVPEKVFVYWVSSSSVIDLRSSRDISIPAHNGPAYGYIIATSDPKDIALYTNRFEFRKCYPNPFGKAATMEFTVPYAWNKDGSKHEGETREVSLCIYNLSGQKVATVLSGPLAVGEHRKVWNGKSETGRVVATGLYIARLASGDFRKTMTLMKVR